MVNRNGSKVRDIVTLLRHFTMGGGYRRLTIQITTACEASCQQCEYGRKNVVKVNLPREKIFEIIRLAGDWQFFILTLTGGEPFLFLDDLLDYANLAGAVGIRRVISGTNGGFLQRLYARYGDSDRYRCEVQQLAKRITDSALHTFWISIDSANREMHENNRCLPGVLEAIRIALPIFHQMGIYPSLNMGVSRMIDGACPDWEKEGFHDQAMFSEQKFKNRYSLGFDAFFDLACSLGFTIVSAVYPMGETHGPFGAASEFLTNFRAWELPILFESLDTAVATNRWKIRIVNPRSTLFLLRRPVNDRPRILPCSAGHDLFFIAPTDGLTYSCGYLNKKLGTFDSLDFDALKKAKRICTLCHWQCCFDPDQLVGRLNPFHTPQIALVSLMGRNEFSQLVRQDLMYSRACDFFDGRTSPNHRKLGRFKAMR